VEGGDPRTTSVRIFVRPGPSGLSQLNGFSHKNNRSHILPDNGSGHAHMQGIIFGTSRPKVFPTHNEYTHTQHQESVLCIRTCRKRGNRGALVDRGANGGIIGNDAHVLYTHPGQEVDVTGIDNHQIDSLKVVDASAKIFTQRGEAIGIFRQYAYHGKGRIIHSSGQIEWCKGNIVHDQSLKVGGAQHVRTLDGYVLPIDIDNGLPYISQVPHTQKEFYDLPHVIFSSSAEWDPTVLYNKLFSQPNWFDIVKKNTEDGYLRASPFDAHGNYIYRYPNKKPRSCNSKIQHTVIRSLPSLQTNHDHDDDSSIESSDTIDNYLTKPNGRKRSFRECYHLACDGNPIYVCTEHDLCKSEPQDKPENPTSEPTKSIETNKTPVQVKKKPIDYSQYRAHFTRCNVCLVDV